LPRGWYEAGASTLNREKSKFMLAAKRVISFVANARDAFNLLRDDMVCVSHKVCSLESADTRFDNASRYYTQPHMQPRLSVDM
jgi:hypothetical protein